MNLFGFNIFNSYFSNYQNYLRFILIITPVFALVIKHWLSYSVFIFFLFSLIFNIKYIKKISVYRLHRFHYLMIFIFLSPFFSVFISQIIRSDFYLNNYDSPLRLVFCVSIFLAISRGWLSDSKHISISLNWLKISFPTALLFIYAYRPAITYKWGQDRFTTYFVDPLSFGIYTLLFGITSFAALVLYWRGLNIFNRIYLMLGFALGINLSIQSGSRTGWISIPIIFTIVFITYVIKNDTKINKLFVSIITIFLFNFIIYILNPHFFEKIILGLNEFINYNWYVSNQDNSTSIRLSLYRIGLSLLIEKPLSGWGDLGWVKSINISDATAYASEHVMLSAKHGFHNEFITNSVRSGIWGTISSLSLYIIPIYIAIKISQKAKNNTIEMISLLLIFICIHLFFSSMTTETTNLIYLSSLVGLMISVLAGELLFFLHLENANKLN